MYAENQAQSLGFQANIFKMGAQTIGDFFGPI